LNGTNEKFLKTTAPADFHQPNPTLNLHGPISEMLRTSKLKLISIDFQPIFGKFAEREHKN